MKSLQNISLLFVAVLLAASTVLEQVHIEHHNVEHAEIGREGETVIIILWTVKDYELIADYSLERRISQNSSGYQGLNRSNCAQTGSKSFRCEDRDLYKESTDQTAATGSVSYRLRVTHNDGSSHTYFTTDNISYTTNAVRRTWGDIKSMFQ